MKPSSPMVENSQTIPSKQEDVEGGAAQEPAAVNTSETTWDSPSDPANPYNWPSSRKVSVAVLVSGSQLVTTMSASVLAPALGQILRDVNFDPSTGQIAFSVFFLGLGFAPFLVAPLAEMYGRKPVWIGGNLWYILWNSLCPVGYNKGLMIAGRFLSACGASVGVTLTSSVVADMYEMKDRGKSIAVAGIFPYLGPALGPIVGGLAAQHLWWPWLFWILSIFDAVILVLGYFIIRETYAPVLLLKKRKRRDKDNASREGREGGSSTPSSTYCDFWTDFFDRIGPAVLIPLRLITHRPIILLLSLGGAIGFGIYTLVLSNFASLFMTKYHQSETMASLHYLAITLGIVTTTQLGGQLMDYLWRRSCRARPNEVPVPEYRIPYIIIGLIPGVAGIFWYGWAAEGHAPWIVVDLGIVFFTCGQFAYAQGLLAYQVDEFKSQRAASASAATRVWTYLLGFTFPIFAPELYQNLGYGWGGSLLAFLLLTLGAVVIFILIFWGKMIRQIGKDER